MRRSRRAVRGGRPSTRWYAAAGSQRTIVRRWRRATDSKKESKETGQDSQAAYASGLDSDCPDSIRAASDFTESNRTAPDCPESKCAGREARRHCPAQGNRDAPAGHGPARDWY